jgi:hypothetical protein
LFSHVGKKKSQSLTKIAWIQMSCPFPGRATLYS